MKSPPNSLLQKPLRMPPNHLCNILLTVFVQNLRTAPNIPLPIQQIHTTPFLPRNPRRHIILNRNFLSSRILPGRQMKQMPLPGLFQVNRKRPHERPHGIIINRRNRLRETIIVDIRPHKTRVRMHKAHSRVRFREMLHRQRGHCDGVLVRVQKRECVFQIEVGCVDGEFEPAAVDAYYPAWT